jgi:hypothetical protein
MPGMHDIRSRPTHIPAPFKRGLAAAGMASSKEDELVPVKPGRWTMYALISLQGLPHCELAAASALSPPQAASHTAADWESRRAFVVPQGRSEAACRHGCRSWFVIWGSPRPIARCSWRPGSRACANEICSPSRRDIIRAMISSRHRVDCAVCQCVGVRIRAAATCAVRYQVRG